MRYGDISFIFLMCDILKDLCTPYTKKSINSDFFLFFCSEIWFFSLGIDIGPPEARSYEFIHVRLSVTQDLSNRSKDFPNFWHEISCHFMGEKWQPAFPGKIWFAQKRGKGSKCPKYGPFWYLLKNI